MASGRHADDGEAPIQGGTAEGRPEGKVDARSSVWAKAFEHNTALVLIIGVLFFCVLSGLYDQFYGAFGLTSVDLGIDYKETLGRSWGFILYLAIISTGLANAAFSYREDSGKERKGLKVFLGVCAVLVLGGMSALSAVVAGESSKVLGGEAVPPIEVNFGFRIMLLDVHAHRVEQVLPVNSMTPDPAHCEKLMHLGSSDRTYILYCADAGKERVVRLSMDRYVLHSKEAP
ncbi:hypothetical protein ACFYZH_09930 [Streptomyces abikoensis]|uniref:hypothetical protein n=1 Tax=Streptomyces abikoensis TaxID=97398 RepID=UPI00369C166F